MEPILQPIIKLPLITENTIRITAKGLTLHEGLINKLALTDTDRILIYNDKLDIHSIYLKKSSNGYSLVKRGRTYMINSLGLKRRLKELLGIDKAVYKIGEPEYIKNEKVIPILTVKNLLDEK